MVTSRTPARPETGGTVLGTEPAGARRGAAHRALQVLLVALLLPLGLLQALPAAAASATTVAGVKLTAISTHGIRVTLRSMGSGWTYTLYASTEKQPIAVANMKKKQSSQYRVSSTKPDLTLELPRTTKPYFYRIQATRKTAHHTSDYFSTGLRAAAPTSLAAAKAERGAVRLTWKGSAASYQVDRSTDYAFRTDLTTYRVWNGARAFTPSEQGSYYYRVRGVNGSTTGAYSKTVHASLSKAGQPVRAMTYNLLSLAYDGTQPDGGDRIAPWSQRREAAAQLLRSADPDVVAVQEAGAYTGAERGPRQVDSFVDALGSSYALARTEAPPWEKGYFRICSYVLYKPAALAPVGDGGSWVLGEVPGGRKYAAYQAFKSRESGATFLFVSAHLLSGGTNGDTLRKQETEALVTQARAYAAAHGGLPIVYGGDYNSHEKHPLDGPAVAMTTAGNTDARNSAQALTNAQFNSSNVYRRVPPAFGLAMDHLYVSPGVGVRSWGQALDLDGTRFAGTIPSDHNPVYSDLVIPR